jgi:hypothetical protein
VRSGGSYLSQSDLRIHFGLGDHPRVDKLEVLWPGGRVESIPNLAGDRYYTIREGAGVIRTGDPKPGNVSGP